MELTEEQAKQELIKMGVDVNAIQEKYDKFLEKIKADRLGNADKMVELKKEFRNRFSLWRQESYEGNEAFTTCNEEVWQFIKANTVPTDEYTTACLKLSAEISEYQLKLFKAKAENEKLGKEYVIAIDTWRAEVEKLQTENQKLQKDIDDFTKAYAKQIQLIVDVTDKVRTIIGIEPIEFVKKELLELKEVLLNHVEESVK